MIQGTVQFRHDSTANWELNKTGVPKDGEASVGRDKGDCSVGDGVTTYENLPTIGAGSSATHYEGTRGEGETDNDVITRVLDGATPKKDDIFVVKTLISGDQVFLYRLCIQRKRLGGDGRQLQCGERIF